MTTRNALGKCLGVLSLVLGLATTSLYAQQPTSPAYVPGSGYYYQNSNGWQGYAPGYVWPGPAPSTAWNGYAPAPPPAATAPAPARSGGAWRGYTPGTGWEGYNPGGAWRGYVPAPGGRVTWRGSNPPNRPGELYSFHAGEARIYGSSVRAIPPTAYRELGTGRPVPLSKPWLPNSP